MSSNRLLLKYNHMLEKRRMVFTHSKNSALSIFGVVLTSSFYWFLVLLVWDKQRYDIVNSNPLFNWSSSEWLIGYQGGFVRRGLFGSVINYLVDNGIEKNTALTSFPSFCFFLLASIWFFLAVRSCCRKSSWVHAPFACFLINPAALFFYLTNGNIFRKDIAFIAILFLSIVAIASILKFVRLPFLRLVIVVGLMFISSILLAGLHEGLYVFIALPILLFALLQTRIHLESSVGFRAVNLVIFGSMIFFISLLVGSVVFNGDSSNVIAICQSWSHVWPVDCIQENLPHLGAISSLGWSASQAISLSGLRNILSKTSSLNLLSIILFATVTARILAAVSGLKEYKSFINIFALLALPGCLLLIVGCDWGRFLSVSLTLSSLLAMAIPSFFAFPEAMPTIASKPLKVVALSLDRLFVLDSSDLALTKRLSHWVLPVSLFLGLPLIGYSSVDQALSIGVWNTFVDRVIWILQVFFNQSVAR